MEQINEIPKNCMQCPAHKLILDPDPHDWFCDDDHAVLCTLTQGNPSFNPESHYRADKQNAHRCVTVSCRPYNLEKECNVPNWCPKKTPAKTPIEHIEESISKTLDAIRNNKPVV